MPETKKQTEEPTALMKMPDDVIMHMSQIEEYAETGAIATREDIETTAREYRKINAEMKSKILALIKPMKDAAKLAHTKVCDFEKASVKPNVDYEAAIVKKIQLCLADLEVKRKAEEERLKKERETELENARKRIFNYTKAAKNINEKIALMAQRLEECDDELEAEEINAQLSVLEAKRDGKVEQIEEAAESIAVGVPEPVVAPQKVKGQYYDYDITVVNKEAVIKAVAGNPVLLGILDINITNCKAFAKQKVNIPGLRVNKVAKVRR